MFDVFGSEIVWEGRTVADLRGNLSSSLVSKIEDELRAFASIDEIESEKEVSSKSAYDEGVEDGEATAKEDMQKELEAAGDVAYARGYDEGRASALADATLAGNAERVELLLQAMSKAYEAIARIRDGVQDEKRSYAKRSMKVSEAKACAQATCHTLRLALNEYRADND